MSQEESQKNQKIRVGILYGGKSAEHEVSIRSAENVINALDKDKFEPILINISKTGKWRLQKQDKLSSERIVLSDTLSPQKVVTLIPGNSQDDILASEDYSEQMGLDVVFPVLHGPMGEDGSIQGFLELADVPYVGPNVLGSAIGMDKDVMKRLLRDADIAVADFEVIRLKDLDSLKPEDITEKLGLPLFVKPANMGSSVGVTKVDSLDALMPAIKQAFDYDTKVLIEMAIVGDEIECAILGNDNPKASVIGRIIPKHDKFYSYDAKYIDEDGAGLEIPADINESVTREAQEVALKAFKTLECEGMSRVDMFARADGTIIVNEINTIPGFTAISMYPKLWEASGLPYTELITSLIELAIERSSSRKHLKTSYNN